MGNDSIKKTLLVTILLSLACSIVVSFAAVSLKPIQDQNVVLDVQRNILSISGLAQNAKSLDAAEVEKLYAQVRPALVDLKTGKYVQASEKEIAAYDQRAAAKDPAESRALKGSQDIASINRQANVAKVYLIEKDGKTESIMLPVHGYGLWSTMYGFLALDINDLDTVVGFGFYDQAETPGLGGEVDNPTWKGRWPGKKVYDTKGDVALHVIKGAVDPSNPNASEQIDGLAGATLTANGVSNLLQFWMGDQGFKPFLTNLKAGDA
ncbi:Na(+)-translocating NADH-quinone reductase subunit C [Endozoicomonas lisbonensis]|uniref:Na(+)-translocating NADH-quinone reductase subunit C n=1 Tax=Endozoicomonas lisbonensis TaxID=3120522 RepID=A0ABV2SNE7_9GAMM